MPNRQEPVPPTNTDKEAEDDDQRIVRRTDPEISGDRGITEDADRVNELDNLMSDDEYEALVRAEFEQVALPSPPALAGWHLCWLTTSSQYDNIAKRQRIGYRPVRQSEMPNFDPSNGQSLERYQGFVTCNEMVLHKIPEPYFHKMMSYFHHKRPAEGDEGTLRQVKKTLEEQDSSGRELSEILGTGFLDMERSAKSVKRQPRFAS